MTAFTHFSALDSVVVSILDSSNVFNSCVFDANALLPDFAGGETHTFQKKGEEKGERKRKFKLLEGTQNGKISFLSAPPAA